MVRFLEVEDRLSEFAEEVERVVGARSRLRMVLHAERGQRAVADPLDRAVVEVDVRHLDAGGEGRGVHGPVVVLARDN